MYCPTLVRHFFVGLESLDAEIAKRVAAGRCRHCGGALHRSDYARKPRGALIAVAGEAMAKRFSLCCGRRGCRKRALPPSVRFLGRRVYLEVVVVLVAALAQTLARIREATATTGVPAQTIRRWLAWWQGKFPRLSTWLELRARLTPPPPDEAQLPRSLLAHLGCEPASARTGEVMSLLARLLAPLTTSSVVDGSRFVRAAWLASEAG